MRTKLIGILYLLVLILSASGCQSSQSKYTQFEIKEPEFPALKLIAFAESDRGIAWQYARYLCIDSSSKLRNTWGDQSVDTYWIMKYSSYDGPNAIVIIVDDYNTLSDLYSALRILNDGCVNARLPYQTCVAIFYNKSGVGKSKGCQLGE